jgi:hypothetical protein
MALEPVVATADQGASPELRDMTRRFRIGCAFALPVFALEMGGHLFDIHHLVAARFPQEGQELAASSTRITPSSIPRTADHGSDCARTFRKPTRSSHPSSP